MSHDSRQVTLLARILIAKHGAKAPSIAAQRVLQWALIGDVKTADLWVEVVQTALGEMAWESEVAAPLSEAPRQYH
ncbi:MAG: hypothetical protein JO010_12735 [Alphaproteobacteria bacterium]|nr:hypothetical protein [Alphaproteobacteria bacterium]